MTKRLQLFTPQNAYPLIREMFKSVGLKLPVPLLDKQVTISFRHEMFMYVEVSREDCDIPCIRFRTRSAHPTTLLTVRFEGCDVHQYIHPHHTVETAGMPEDPSHANAVLLFYTMRRAPLVEAYFTEVMGFPSRGEVLNAMNKAFAKKPMFLS